MLSLATRTSAKHANTSRKTEAMSDDNVKRAMHDLASDHEEALFGDSAAANLLAKILPPDMLADLKKEVGDLVGSLEAEETQDARLEEEPETYLFTVAIEAWADEGRAPEAEDVFLAIQDSIGRRLADVGIWSINVEAREPNAG